MIPLTLGRAVKITKRDKRYNDSCQGLGRMRSHCLIAVGFQTYKIKRWDWMVLIAAQQCECLQFH